jgi:SIR2-like domain
MDTSLAMNSPATRPKTGSSDSQWTEYDWEGLLFAINYGKCTPFLGAGACAGVLPLGGEIAEAWATEYGYPFPDRTNLVRVAQYMAVHVNPMLPQFKIMEKFGSCGLPDFNAPDEPHSVVADLNLPVYITTNYDDFLTRAIQASTSLREGGRTVQKQPRREYCRWYQARQRQRPQNLPRFAPTAAQPLVFHLHGMLDLHESMVLTEDDYLDFLMYISELQSLIPPRVEQAFSQSALLFLGYSLEDLNFKVLFRKLAAYMQRNEGARHVSVQLAPQHGKNPTPEELEQAERQRLYLARHFDLQKVKVYWGTCREFCGQLRTRWESFNERRPAA